MKTTPSGPMFPQQHPDGSISHPCASLRACLAGMMLQAIVSNPTMTEHPNYDREGAAREACQLTDALIAELEKEVK